MSYEIPLIKPYITQETIRKVTDILQSGYLTEGLVTKEFEKSVAQYIGAKYAISFTSNTTGMETVLRSLKIGNGDEVIIPNYTYPATASVIKIVGANPVIVDVEKETGNIDPIEVEKAITKKTKAILAVSLFGNPINYDMLNHLADKHGLTLLDDSACSIGAEYKGEKVGKIAKASIFSFHPRKFITTGEGGMVVTDDKQIAKFCHSYKNFGMSVSEENEALVLEKSKFDTIGTNYKLSNVLSGIGLIQMERIEELLEERRSLAKNYDFLLANQKDISPLKTTQGGNNSYQSYCVIVKNRDNVIKEMRHKGIEVQIGSIVLSEQKAFKEIRKIGNLEVSKYLGMNSLVLPMYHGMKKEEQKKVVDELTKILKEY